MYISVIPTSKSQGTSSYTYFVSTTWENQVSIGGVVEVPFGKDTILGIVVAIDDISQETEGMREIRPIHSVVSNTSLLDTTILGIIQRIAEKYYIPIHKSLSLFLPASLFHRLEKRNYVLKDQQHREKGIFQVSQNIHHYIHSTFSPKDLRRYLNPKSIIIFPDDIMLFSFMSQNEKNEKILIIPSEATATKRVQAWIDIYEEKYEIIVGTRRLLYYNLNAYDTIVYIEDAFGGEHFQYPTSIRSLDILSLLSATHLHNVSIVSSSPSLELFAKFPEIKIQTIS